jgi:hypothetical protein
MTSQREEDDMDPVPGAPSDNTTATAVIDDLREQGYGADFVVGDGGVVRCTRCRHEERPEDVVVDVFRRMEGASDPDDMSAILAMTCRECGTKGIVMVGYGPRASAEEGDLLLAVDTPEDEGTDASVDDPA